MILLFRLIKSCTEKHTLNSETKANIKIRNKFHNFSNGVTNAYNVWKYCFKKRNQDDPTWMDKVIFTSIWPKCLVYISLTSYFVGLEGVFLFTAQFVDSSHAV